MSLLHMKLNSIHLELSYTEKYFNSGCSLHFIAFICIFAILDNKTCGKLHGYTVENINNFHTMIAIK